MGGRGGVGMGRGGCGPGTTSIACGATGSSRVTSNALEDLCDGKGNFGRLGGGGGSDSVPSAGSDFGGENADFRRCDELDGLKPSGGGAMPTGSSTGAPSSSIGNMGGGGGRGGGGGSCPSGKPKMDERTS